MSKDKQIHRFSVGDPAKVMRGEHQANTGTITKVTNLWVLFTGPTDSGGTRIWKFERKDTRWIQTKADHYELFPT